MRSPALHFKGTFTMNSVSLIKVKLSIGYWLIRSLIFVSAITDRDCCPKIVVQVKVKFNSAFRSEGKSQQKTK